MFMPYQFIIVYPLLTLNASSQSIENCKPYKPHTTSMILENKDVINYEKFWNNIIKEDCDSNSTVE